MKVKWRERACVWSLTRHMKALVWHRQHSERLVLWSRQHQRTRWTSRAAVLRCHTHNISFSSQFTVYKCRFDLESSSVMQRNYLHAHYYSNADSFGDRIPESLRCCSNEWLCKGDAVSIHRCTGLDGHWYAWASLICPRSKGQFSTQTQQSYSRLSLIIKWWRNVVRDPFNDWRIIYSWNPFGNESHLQCFYGWI